MNLTGNVRDAKTQLGMPAVVFKSTSTGENLGDGVQANINGLYELQNVNPGDYITAKLIGYLPLTKKASANNVLNFSLIDKTANLPGVEIVADKITPKKDNWFSKSKNVNLIAGVSAFLISIIGAAIFRKKK